MRAAGNRVAGGDGGAGTGAGDGRGGRGDGGGGVTCGAGRAGSPETLENSARHRSATSGCASYPDARVPAEKHRIPNTLRQSRAMRA